MLTFLELDNLFLMALGAGVGGGDTGHGIVIGRFVVLAVADSAADVVLAVLAQLPGADDVWSCLLMALDALLAEKRRNQECGQQESQADKEGFLFHFHLLIRAAFGHPPRHSISKHQLKVKGWDLDGTEGLTTQKSGADRA